MKAILALADGRIFEGKSFGAGGEVTGEVVFNTAMTGYQEVLTDPSYRGQIVVMTLPHVGNYPVAPAAEESSAGGFVRQVTTPAAFATALAEARTQGRPILVDFSAGWCVVCREIDQTVLTDPVIRARLQNVSVIRADVTADTPETRALMARFEQRVRRRIAVALLARAERVIPRPIEHRRQALLRQVRRHPRRVFGVRVALPGDVPQPPPRHQHRARRRAHRPAPRPHDVRAVHRHPLRRGQLLRQIGHLAGKRLAAPAIERLTVEQHLAL